MEHNMDMMNSTMAGGGGMYDMDGMKPMMMMQMYFSVDKEVTILFKKWKTTNAGELFGSCLAIFVIGILYEGLKAWRQSLLLKTTKVMVPANDEGDLNLIQDDESKSFIRTRFSKQHVIQSLLHIVQVTVGYLLMLAAMTYNVWVFIAVILGAGIGNFLFAVKPTVLDNSDHCN